MAENEQKEVELVQSLQQLREQLTEGTPSHDVEARIYSDKFDEKDPTQDCANIIYHFEYDEAKIEKIVASKYEEIHQKYLSQIQTNEKSIELLAKNISELKLDHNSLKKENDSLEHLTVAYLTIIAVADQRCMLSKESAFTSAKNVLLSMDEDVEKAEVFALEAIKEMPQPESSFFVTYLRNKKILLSTPKILDEIDKMEKILEATLADRTAVVEEYLNGCAKFVSEEELKVQSESYRAKNQLFAAKLKLDFAKVKNEIINKANVARIVVFLGAEKKKVSKQSKKLYSYKVRHQEIKDALEPQLTLDRIDFESSIGNLKSKLKEVKDKCNAELEALAPIKDNWIKLNADVVNAPDVVKAYEAALAKHSETLNKSISEIETKFETKLEELKKQVVDEIEYTEDIASQVQFNKDFEQVYVDIKNGLYTEISQAKTKSKELGILAKRILEDRNLENKKRADTVVKTNEKVFNSIIALSKERKVLLEKAYKSYTSLVLSEIKDQIKKNSAIGLVYSSKLDLGLIELLAKENLRHSELALKINESTESIATNSIKRKYDTKLNNIYNKMKVQKAAVALGRAAASNKMIDKEYAKLAKLQNRTKNIQKSYDDALAGNKNTFVNSTEEINITKSNLIKKYNLGKIYDENVISSGVKYASLYEKTLSVVEKAEVKFNQRYEAEEVVYLAKKNTLIHTEEAWRLKCENEERLLKEKSQAVVNSQYLADARAIRVRRFPAKYTLKRIAIRIFCIVAVSALLGLIQLIIPNVIIGFAVGVALAIIVELFIYFFKAHRTYIMPVHNKLALYNSRGELLFILNPNDIVNEIMLTKRKGLFKLNKKLIGFEVIVESGADVFRFGIQDKGYRELLIKVYSRYLREKKQAKLEYYEEVRKENKELVKASKSSKPSKIN